MQPFWESMLRRQWSGHSFIDTEGDGGQKFDLARLVLFRVRHLRAYDFDTVRPHSHAVL